MFGLLLVCGLILTVLFVVGRWLLGCWVWCVFWVGCGGFGRVVALSFVCVCLAFVFIWLWFQLIVLLCLFILMNLSLFRLLFEL